MNPIGKAMISLRLVSGAVVLGIMLTGCGGGPQHSDSSRTLVPVTDIGSVVGEWEGTVKKEHAVLPEGMVQLTIHANGTYTFVGERVTDVVLGSGFLEMREGRLSGDTDRRLAILTLYDYGGEPVLVVESTVRQTGERYRGELKRAGK